MAVNYRGKKFFNIGPWSFFQVSITFTSHGHTIRRYDIQYNSIQHDGTWLYYIQHNGTQNNYIQNNGVRFDAMNSLGVRYLTGENLKVV